MSEMRILVVRADRLGDTLLSTPLLAALHSSYPDAEITALASPLGAQALAGNPHVHDIATIDPCTGLFGKLHLARKLRRRKFDATLCLSEKLWPRLITWLAGSPVRVGFYPGRTQPLVSLLCRFGITHRVDSGQLPANLSPMHEVERYGLLLNALDLQSEATHLEVYLSETDINWAKDWLSSHVPNGATPVVINLNQKWIGDGWTTREVGFILDSLISENPDAFFIATTDSADAHIADSLQTSKSDRFCTVTGESFGRWAALIKLSRALITMDTGASHLGAAVGTAVVDIFPEAGFEHCSKRWSPWKVQHRILRRDRLNSSTQTDQFSEAITGALKELII